MRHTAKAGRYGMMAVILYLSTVILPVFAMGGNGGMQATPFDNSGSVRLVECTADMSLGGFAGLTLFNITDMRETLVYFTRRVGDCITNHTLASCTLNEEQQSMTAKVLVTDLAEEETRTYQCNIHYFDSRSWGQTYFANITTEIKAVSVNEQSTDTADGQNDKTTTQTTSAFEGIEEDDTDHFHIDIISMSIGGGAVFILMGTVMMMCACRRRLCRSCATRTSKTSAIPNGINPGQGDNQESSLARRPPAMLPPGAFQADYQYESSSGYLTPISRPRQNPVSPNFQSAPYTDSSSFYEIVN